MSRARQTASFDLSALEPYRKGVVVEEEQSPPDPYNPDYLREGLEVENGVVGFLKEHPLEAGFVAFLVVAFVIWYVRRSR